MKSLEAGTALRSILSLLFKERKAMGVNKYNFVVVMLFGFYLCKSKLHEAEMLQTADLLGSNKLFYGDFLISNSTLKHSFQRISYQYSAFLAIHTCSLIYDTLTHRLIS